MVLVVKQYKDEYMEEIRIFAGVPYTVDRPIFTTDMVEIQRVPSEISLPADAYVSFRVNHDTTSIKLELKNSAWESPICRWKAPYCQNDFQIFHKKDPYMYILLTFVNGQIIFDYLYGYQKFLHKSMPYSVHNKVEDTSRECRIFYKEDMPNDEVRQLCNYTPLDSIDIW